MDILRNFLKPRQASKDLQGSLLTGDYLQPQQPTPRLENIDAIVQAMMAGQQNPMGHMTEREKLRMLQMQGR